MLRDYFKNLYTGTRDEFFALADRFMDEEKKLFVVTANPETMMIGEKDPEMGKVLCKKTTTIVPDGIGVVKAARSIGLDIPGRVPGVELAWELLTHAGATGKSIYLYGAKEEVLQALIQRIRREIPGAEIAGARNGYGKDDEGTFADILEKKPDVVLVALGIPRQEILIDRWLAKFEKGIFVGVGGSFDVLSGTKKRAPEIFIKLNLEWLYRIMKEPSRFGRFFRSNVKFLAEVKKIGKI